MSYGVVGDTVNLRSIFEIGLNLQRHTQEEDSLRKSPGPFRLRFRARLREAIAEVVRARLDGKDAIARIEAWARERIDPADRKRFVEVVEIELASLHEGNFARYQIRPSEFEAWRKAWQGT